MKLIARILSCSAPGLGTTVSPSHATLFIRSVFPALARVFRVSSVCYPGTLPCTHWMSF